MAVKKVTKIYGVDDIKVFPVTKDDETGFACGDSVDMVGARQISVDFEIEEKELTGDEMTLDTSAKIKSVTFNFEVAKLNLEAMALFSGGTISTTGMEDTEKATYSLGSKASYNQKYFQLQAKINSTDNDGGDLHICIYKAKATSMPMNGVEQDYAKFTVDGRGVFTSYEFSDEKKLIDIDVNKKAVALTAKVSA